MLLKQFSYSVVTRGVVACINFLVLIISSRYLGVETRGQISLFILNIANVQMISEIFTGYALVHFIPKYSLKKIVHYGVFWIMMVVFLGSWMLWYLDYLIPYYEIHFIIISCMVLLNTFCMVVLLGKGNIRLYNVLSILQPLLLLVVLTFNIFFEKKLVLDSYLEGLFYSFGLALALNLITLFQYIQKNTNEKFELLPIVSNGFLSQWSNWMHLLSNRFSYYVLSLIGLQVLGIYSTATSLLESIFVIYSGVSTVVLTYVSNTTDRAQSRKITIQAATASFLLSFIAIVVILILPEPWLLWILGKGFKGIQQPMKLLSMGALMISYSAVLSHYFSGIGILKYNAISNTLACLVTILFSHLFVQKWGINGAALVATISYSIEAILIVYFFIKHEHLKWREILAFKSLVYFLINHKKSR